MQVGWDREHTRAKNLGMDELDIADIWPTDIESFANRWPRIVLEVITKHLPNDFFRVGSIDVVSDKLRKVMEATGLQAEFLPVFVLYKGKKCSRRSFFFCHILAQVDCFDHQKGQCTYHKAPGFEDHVDEIQKLVIDEGKAAGHHLFRMSKGAEYVVCVSDELAARISESGTSGMRFVEPEKWK